MSEKEAPPPPYEQQSPLYNKQLPPEGPSQQTVYVTHTTTLPFAFGPRPVKITCPFCNETMISSVKIEPNTKTHLFAVLLCALGCWPCFWLPYIADGCQSKKHYCSNCHTYLGVYSD